MIKLIQTLLSRSNNGQKGSKKKKKTWQANKDRSRNVSASFTTVDPVYLCNVGGPARCWSFTVCVRSRSTKAVFFRDSFTVGPTSEAK